MDKTHNRFIERTLNIQISNRKLIVLVLLLAIFASIPYLTGFFATTLFIKALAFSIIVLGFNLLFGFTGLLSFGQAMFVAIGAYTVAMVIASFNVHMLSFLLIIAITFTIVFGLIIGYFCVRYTDIYFAMLTLAFSMLVHSFLIKFTDITGGSQGMNVPRPALFGFGLEELSLITYTQFVYYYYVLAIAVIGFVAMWFLINSPFGMTLRSIRDNAEKARFLGIDVVRYRIYAFVISGIYATVGGALLGPLIGQATPGLSHWTLSGDIVFMALLGGFQSFIGPVIGAFVIVFLEEELSSITSFWRLIFGVILAVMIVVAPEGIHGLLKRAYGYVEQRLPGEDSGKE